MAKVTIADIMAKDVLAFQTGMNEVLAKAIRDEADPTEAMNAYSAALVAKEQAKADKVEKAKSERVEATKGKRDALLAVASERFNLAWNGDGTPEMPSLAGLLAEIPADVLKGVSFIIIRDDKGKPTDGKVVLSGAVNAKPKNPGTAGQRGASLTVDGKEYASAAEAKRELLPAKADAEMSRTAIISALKTAGHTVAE
jgi:hypothetical protein